jgi:hypothetical protein
VEALTNGDDDPASELEGGTITTPVGVTDDSTKDRSELSKVNVGRGVDEAGTVTVLIAVSSVVLVSVTTVVDAGLGMLLGETVSAELYTLPGCELASDEETGTVLGLCGGGTGMTNVTEDDTIEVKVTLDAGTEGVEAA